MEHEAPLFLTQFCVSCRNRRKLARQYESFVEKLLKYDNTDRPTCLLRKIAKNAHADSCRNVKNYELTIASGVKEVVLYRSILTLAIDFLREKEKNASLWSHRFTLSLP